MKNASVFVQFIVLLSFIIPTAYGSTFTPLPWQASEPIGLRPPPVGPFEVAIGFDRCFERTDLGEEMLRHLVSKSDLVSAAVFRFGGTEEFENILKPLLDNDGLRATAFQFGTMQLAHGTSVSSHEARESTVYKGDHPHEKNILGSGVGVAIVDSGVDAKHIQLADTADGNPRWIAGYDAVADKAGDPEPRTAHGSAVAGVALGADLSGTYYKCRYVDCRGMAPEAGLIDIKVTDSAQVQLSRVQKALNWLGRYYEMHGWPPTVANLSFFTCQDDEVGVRPPAGEAQALVDLGIPVVAAHGNASDCRLPSRCAIGGTCTRQTGSPGSADGVMTVAGTDDRARVNREDHDPFCDGFCGPRGDGAEKPDLSAAAEAVIAPSPSQRTIDDYGVWSGTSVAAAHASGAVALVKSVRPWMTPASIKKQLIDSADRQHNPGRVDWDPELGWGILRLDWLTTLDATPSDRLADLTFEGCLPETTDGLLSDCRLEDESVPPWRNGAGIEVGEADNGYRYVTLRMVNHGPMSVSALVRLEAYERAIGNRHYYNLGDQTVELDGWGKATSTFRISNLRLQHFRASIHSAWDRSYKNNRTRYNTPVRGSRAEFLVDSPFLEPTTLRLKTRSQCRVMGPEGAEHDAITLTPEDCPETWILESEDGEPCDLSISGAPGGAEHQPEFDGIRLVPPSFQ